jgi:proteic killer suppression protein
MDVIFADDDLDQLETDLNHTAGYQPAVVKAFRKRMQLIRAAPDERLFHTWRSLNFEKLKGKRNFQYSMRLNDQFRLIVEFEKKEDKKVIRIVSIEDYH